MPVTVPSAVFAPTGSGIRSERSATTPKGAKLLVFRRQSARGWLWQGHLPTVRDDGQHRPGAYSDGRAPTRAAAEAAALDWAAGV